MTTVPESSPGPRRGPAGPGPAGPCPAGPGHAGPGTRRPGQNLDRRFYASELALLQLERVTMQ